MHCHEFKIGKTKVGVGHSPYIIAEIGNNHDARLNQAHELVEAAHKVGADAVKFQTFIPDKLVHPTHELYDFFSKFQLPFKWHYELKEHAESLGLTFLSTPFDKESADFLKSLKVSAYKIASSDLTNLGLIRKCATFGKPIMISTGMGTLKEAGAAIEACHIEGNYSVAILHCVSIYPTPVADAQLQAITEFSRLFKVITGFSDHSLSPVLAPAAITLGARIIEKHLTLSRKLDGPDHAVALEPMEFRIMAQGCRDVFESTRQQGKILTDSLREVRKVSRRGLYAACDIKKGTELNEENIIALRPVAAFTDMDTCDVFGKTASCDISRHEPLTKKMFL